MRSSTSRGAAAKANPAPPVDQTLLLPCPAIGTRVWQRESSSSSASGIDPAAERPRAVGMRDCARGHDGPRLPGTWREANRPSFGRHGGGRAPSGGAQSRPRDLERRLPLSADYGRSHGRPQKVRATTRTSSMTSAPVGRAAEIRSTSFTDGLRDTDERRIAAMSLADVGHIHNEHACNEHRVGPHDVNSSPRVRHRWRRWPRAVREVRTGPQGALSSSPVATDLRSPRGGSRGPVAPERDRGHAAPCARDGEARGRSLGSVGVQRPRRRASP